MQTSDYSETYTTPIPEKLGQYGKREKTKESHLKVPFTLYDTENTVINTSFDVLLCETNLFLKIHTHFKSDDCDILQNSWDSRVFTTVYRQLFF